MFTKTRHQPSGAERPVTKQTTLLLDTHHLTDMVVEFFSHIFAPISYLQCTTTGRWSNPLHGAPHNYAAGVDNICKSATDGPELDGGPLCREADIARWALGTADDGTSRGQGKSEGRK